MSSIAISRASPGRLVLVVIVAAISIVPFVALVALALGLIGGSGAAGAAGLSLLGRLGAFGEAWRYSHLGRAIFNSAVITAGAVAVVVALAGAAGYSLCRFPLA
jgi:ABC-type glycerol-3-phosphate transport system permease component